MARRLFNFDGLVGPTHNYAGLAYGNLASQQHRKATSNPRAAALQGLAKMRLLAKLGIGQAVLPPHERPHVPTLRRLGFCGTDAQMVAAAAKSDPTLLAAVSSASAMWAANAATVTPSADAADGLVHITPANLCGQLHRAIEAATTTRILEAIFASPRHFVVHAPLPAAPQLGDEGAANHVRLCGNGDRAGVEAFVYGRRGFEPQSHSKLPARQTIEASSAVARLHKLGENATLFLRQNPVAIDAGAFHNDVAAVGEADVFFYHEQAYADAGAANRLRETFAAVCESELRVVGVAGARVSLTDAVASYLFNSQLIPVGDRIELVAPSECHKVPAVARYLAETTGPGAPISAVHYVDVRQSMDNGGGPACLRLRVWMNDDERAAALSGVFWSDDLDAKLAAWIGKHYRERIDPPDLADPKLLEEGRAALAELTQTLGLGSIYKFMR